MRTNIWRVTSLVVLLAMLISPIGASGSANAAPIESQSPAPRSDMRVVESTPVVSQPLRYLAPIKVDPNAPSILKKIQDRLVIPKTENALSNGGFDASIVQDAPVTNNMPAAIANFEGVNNVSGVLPPDTQGDMGWDPSTGTKYYVQWVNLAFEIWDVTDPAIPASLYGPAAGNTLWTGTGGACESYNDGDPITQFDHLSNRWMMTQFALPGGSEGFHQCIAISASADPTGAWYLYDFKTSDTLMNDYPHFGVWPDGYYMSVNQFDESTGFGWAGGGVAAFERSAMLQGMPATMQYIDLGAVTFDYGGMLPSDLDGPAPAVGTPNYFMEWDDSSWLGDAVDTLRIWEFHVDWANPANTTFGADALYTPNAFIATADVDPDMCGGARGCIPQPDTAQGLDAIADRLMYRLQYRDFGSYQTLLTNHTVDSTGTDIAGIHWFELRDTGSGFAMNQESVYAGDGANTENRWMGSIAMDASGNMALGYSVSSSTTYPSIRYTGRLIADPLNTLQQGETSLIAGSGSQTHAAARWGDYSMMAVDASDGCTFWYTQEYLETTGSATWQTRIGAFKFPSCTTEPTSLLSGTVDDGTNPIVGATIDVSGGYSTTTDGTGHYAINLVDGTYSVTASKYGYVSSNAPAVVVTAPGGATQDFTLAAAPASTISGVVTDAATGWPLYARIDIFGFPGSPVFTDPVTGAYSVPLINGAYTFNVSALSGGYADTVTSVVVAGNATEDFGLDADLIACTAPGYAVAPAGFSENFEIWPNTAGWTVIDNEGQGLVWDTNLLEGYPNWTGGAGEAAMVNGDPVDYAGVEYDTELVSPVITEASLANLGLVYKANFITWGQTTLDLDILNVGDVVWTNVSQWTGDHGTLYDLPGETTAVDLAPFVTGDFQLRWHYYTPDIDPWDYYAQIDEVMIGAGCAPIPSAGLVVGNVYDANTNLVIDAAVEDAAMNPALFIDNSADASQDSPLYIIAEPAGAVTLTASAPLYADSVLSPTVVAGSVVRQDFSLDTGSLSVSPTSMAFNTTNRAPTANQLATLANAGGLGTDYEIFVIPGTFGGYAPTGPFAPNTRHFGPKNLNDMDATHIRVDTFTTRNVPIIAAAGDVVTSWDTGLVYGWGLGYNTDLGDLWIGNIGAGGGDNLDHNFTTAGVATGDTIDMTPWVGSFGGDMTYNPFTNTLWQVNVGGDNCIYELDPASMVDTGNKICPLFGTSERGLAFDPLTNTYYAGSWNDNIINHFAPDGTLISAVDVGLPIAGLAFNPSTGHLFVSISYATVSTPGVSDIYVLDVNDDYAYVGAIDIMDGGVRAIPDNSEKGLEIDCNGDLWLQVHATGIDKAVSFASGETGVCDWQASWLTASPLSGNVASYGSTPVSVNVDATGLNGTYNAYLRIVSNTPYGDEILPVSMTVTTIITSTFKSVAAKDGWILESSQTSNVGGTMNSTYAILNVGDNADNSEFRSILHFDTSSLPDTAVIISAQLKVKRVGMVGNPFGHGNLIFAIREPYFGATSGLWLNDFQAGASHNWAGRFNTTPFFNWYTGWLTANGRAFINLTGTTQFRLRFEIGDDNDDFADIIKFNSGNSADELSPQLIIQYYVP